MSSDGVGVGDREEWEDAARDAARGQKAAMRKECRVIASPGAHVFEQALAPGLRHWEMARIGRLHHAPKQHHCREQKHHIFTVLVVRGLRRRDRCFSRAYNTSIDRALKKVTSYRKAV